MLIPSSLPAGLGVHVPCNRPVGLFLVLLTLFTLSLGSLPAGAALVHDSVPVSDSAANDQSIANGNTSRNLAVESDGTIYAVYRSNAGGIRVARSTDGGQSFQSSVQVYSENLEAEIAVSDTGIVYVTWVESGTAKVSRSLDGGSSFSDPVDAGTVDRTVHMATDASYVYLVDASGNHFLASDDNGQTFSTVALNAGQAYSDVHVDPSSGDVIVQVDDPDVKYYVSTDHGNSFGPQIRPEPGGDIFFSVGALSSGSAGRFLFVSGSDTAALKIDVDAQTSESLTFGNNSVSQGRSLTADRCGNVVDGYVNGTEVEFRVSTDLGDTFSAATTVATADSANVFINQTNGDLLYLYEQDGQVYLNVYGGELGNCYNPELSTSSLVFSGLEVGQTSQPKKVEVSNTGEGEVEIQGVAATGDFDQTSDCVGTLAVGAACTVSVTFTPTAVGTRTGELQINTDVFTEPRVASLSGTGLENAPAAVLSPSSLDFGAQVLDTASDPNTVTLSNDGSADLEITDVVLDGPFSLDTNGCGAIVAPGASCSLGVVFSPTTLGPAEGSLVVDGNLSGALPSVALSGEGAEPEPEAVLSPVDVDFGPQEVDTDSAPVAITLTNDGTADLTIGGFTVDAPFGFDTGDCGATLPVGGTCTFQVTFSPVAEGVSSGTLVLNSDAPGAPPEVGLAGEGTAVAVASPEWSVGNIDFGEQPVGETSEPIRLKLFNTGDAELGIPGFTVNGPFVYEDVDCGAALAAGSSCSLDVSFEPVEPGAATGSLGMPTGAKSSHGEVGLVGTGVEAHATVAARPIPALSGRMLVLLAALMTVMAAAALRTR